MLARASKNWKKVKGKIISSQVIEYERGGESGAKSSKANIEYGYEIDGRAFLGNRISFSLPDHRPATAAALVVRYPSGAPVDVFYDPADAKHCTLEQSGGQAFNIMWSIAGMLIIGSSLLDFLIFGSR